MITPPIYAELRFISDCLCERLEEEGAGGLCWCGPYAGGGVAWDHCSECSGDACGMAWTRLVGASQYETFPVASVDFNCRKYDLYEIEVGVVRCMSTTDNGEPISEAEMLLVVQRQLADERAMRLSLKCCGAEFIQPRFYTPLGPLGMCVGGLWTAAIGIE